MDNDTPSRQLAREVLAADRTYFAAVRLSGPAAADGHAKAFAAVMELRLDRFLRGGDHSSFSAEGFPGDSVYRVAGELQTISTST